MYHVSFLAPKGREENFSFCQIRRGAMTDCFPLSIGVIDIVSRDCSEVFLTWSEHPTLSVVLEGANNFIPALLESVLRLA